MEAQARLAVAANPKGKARAAKGTEEEPAEEPKGRTGRQVGGNPKRGRPAGRKALKRKESEGQASP